jgi:putative hemolysin
MELVILTVLIIFNGIFSMSEAALLSSRRARLQTQADEGNTGAKAALQLMDDPNRFLSTVQIGITLIGTIAGVFGGSTLADNLAENIRRDIPSLAEYADAIGVALIVGLTTYLSLVIGELVPKRLALQSPERISSTVAAPMRLLSTLATPLVAVLGVSTTFVIRLMGVKPSDDPEVTETEVLSMIEQGIDIGVFASTEQEMVQGVFDLDATLVREIITPRPDIVWLDAMDSREEISRKIAENTFSTYPVCREDIDDVIGIVRAKDLLLHLLTDNRLDLQSMMQKPLFIPETVRVSDVLRRFKESGIHMALILGEYGGVEGLVTLNDIVEEVVGDVDREDPQITKRDDGSWLIDGYTSINRLEELLPDFDIPEGEYGDYQSLAGFILKRLGRIPEPADHFTWHNYYFEVVDMDNVRIDKVLVKHVL